MSPRTRSTLSALLLTLGALSCGGSSPRLAAGPTPPAVVVNDLAGVQGALSPRADERGVLVNLWATW